MQPQTLPDQYRVTFDLMAGIEPITFPAGATVAEIAEQVTAAFAAAEVPIAVKVAIDLEGDAVTVTENGDVIEHGSITRVDEQPPAKPDYWLTLAAELRLAADRIATLAGTPKPPGVPGASLSVSYCFDETDADKSVPIVDAIAAAFGATAETKTQGRGQARRTQRLLATRIGQVRVRAVADMPNSPTRQQSRAALEAEVAQLRAELAAGGTR